MGMNTAKVTLHTYKYNACDTPAEGYLAGNTNREFDASVGANLDFSDLQVIGDGTYRLKIAIYNELGIIQNSFYTDVFTVDTDRCKTEPNNPCPIPIIPNIYENISRKMKFASVNKRGRRGPIKMVSKQSPPLAPQPNVPAKGNYRYSNKF